MTQQLVLIAEDDADDRFLLQTAFDENGFNDILYFVDNGYDLLLHLKSLKENKSVENFPHFILLDLNMPKRSGREVLEELKNDDFLNKIPVIVFSTTSNENEIQRCMDLGAYSYVTKPVSFEGLLIAIEKIRNSVLVNDNNQH